MSQHKRPRWCPYVVTQYTCQQVTVVTWSIGAPMAIYSDNKHYNY